MFTKKKTRKGEEEEETAIRKPINTEEMDEKEDEKEDEEEEKKDDKETPITGACIYAGTFIFD